MRYEILLFEDQELYGAYRGQTLSVFVEWCERYITRGYVSVDVGDTWAVVRDISGCHKPMMLVLIGEVTEAEKRTLRALGEQPINGHVLPVQ